MRREKCKISHLQLKDSTAPWYYLGPSIPNLAKQIRARIKTKLQQWHPSFLFQHGHTLLGFTDSLLVACNFHSPSKSPIRDPLSLTYLHKYSSTCCILLRDHAGLGPGHVSPPPALFTQPIHAPPRWFGSPKVKTNHKLLCLIWREWEWGNVFKGQNYSEIGFLTSPQGNSTIMLLYLSPNIKDIMRLIMSFHKLFHN